MEKDRLDELISAERNLAAEKNSAEEDIAEKTNSASENLKENSTAEEDTVAEISSMDEDDLELEMDDEDDLELEMDDEDSEMEGYDLDWETDKDFAEESISTEEHSEKQSFTLEEEIEMEMLRDSTEESSATEEDSAENTKENFIEEPGLVFKSIGSVDRTVKFIIVSFRDCGKTKLIKSLFSDPKNFRPTKNNSRRIEYEIYLTPHLHIRICGLKRPQSVKGMKFSDETVFLFCYDVDNQRSFEKLQETWIPTVLKKSMKNMYYLLVGIRRESKTQPKEKNLQNEDEKAAIERQVQELNGQFSAGRAIECCVEDNDSLLNVFQSAIQYVRSRF